MTDALNSTAPPDGSPADPPGDTADRREPDVAGSSGAVVNGATGTGRRRP